MPLSSPVEPPVTTSAVETPAMAEARQAAEVYRQELETWLSSPRPYGAERALSRGQIAAAAILRASRDMDERTFDGFRGQMPGYLLVWSEVVVVSPDPVYFLAESQKHGMLADTAFFTLMGKTLNAYWPVTMEHISGLNGCTRFGSHELVRLYGEWQNFKKRFPGAYENMLKDPNLPLLADIEDQLQNSQSACDGPDTVMDELRTFIFAYPNANITPTLRQRLESIKQHRTKMDFFQGVQHQSKSTGLN